MQYGRTVRDVQHGTCAIRVAITVATVQLMPQRNKHTVKQEMLQSTHSHMLQHTTQLTTALLWHCNCFHRL